MTSNSSNELVGVVEIVDVKSHTLAGRHCNAQQGDQGDKQAAFDGLEAIHPSEFIGNAGVTQQINRFTPCSP